MACFSSRGIAMTESGVEEMSKTDTSSFSIPFIASAAFLFFPVFGVKNGTIFSMGTFARWHATFKSPRRFNAIENGRTLVISKDAFDTDSLAAFRSVIDPAVALLHPRYLTNGRSTSTPSTVKLMLSLPVVVVISLLLLKINLLAQV